MLPPIRASTKSVRSIGNMRCDVFSTGSCFLPTERPTYISRSGFWSSDADLGRFQAAFSRYAPVIDIEYRDGTDSRTLSWRHAVSTAMSLSHYAGILRTSIGKLTAGRGSLKETMKMLKGARAFKSAHKGGYGGHVASWE